MSRRQILQLDTYKEIPSQFAHIRPKLLNRAEERSFLDGKSDYPRE